MKINTTPQAITAKPLQLLSNIMIWTYSFWEWNQHNAAGENSGSCKFAFEMQELTQKQL
jgi:hypothetical protein